MFNPRAIKHYQDLRTSLAVDLVVHCTALLRLSRPLLAATVAGKVPPLGHVESFLDALHSTNATLQSLQGYWAQQLRDQQERDRNLFCFGRS